MSVLLVAGGGESAVDWAEALREALPEERIVLPEPGLDRAAVFAAIVASPPPGALAGLPNLRLIQSLWAGVDSLLADPTLPAGPVLARLVDPALTAAMTESVLLHVLALHRHAPAYRAQQAEALWQPLPYRPAGERRVGVLGLGVLGQAAATSLSDLGFAVSGWSRSARQVAGVRCLSGASGLDRLLPEADMLVNLLPLTAETEDLLDSALFARLPRGAALINLGRGRHLVEADLLAALASGQLSHAVLDVFREEPLPPAHPLWHHPAITITPHVAAPTGRHSAARIAAEAVRAARDGRPVANIVGRGCSY